MSRVTPEEINEMDRLRRIMEGDLNASKESSPLKGGTTAPVDPLISGPGVTAEDIAAMGEILKKMNNAIMAPLVEEASQDSELRSALVTEAVDNGFKIGSWTVQKIVQEGVTGKDEVFYKVYGEKTGEFFQKPFKLHEAATAVVKLMNHGHDINSSQVEELLKLDQEYQRLRLKALEEKARWRRVQGTDMEWKQDVYEAKFDAAKSRALYIKERVKNMLLKIS